MFNTVRKAVSSFIALLFVVTSFSQTSTKDVPKGWHLRDLSKDGYYGISLDKAYEFVKNRKNKTVIVAVIDSGIDTTHEDLKPVLWRNPKELPGNGIDDDRNGYVDDIYGWNFIGGKDGRNVKEDSYEVARVYHRYKSKFQNVSDASTLSSEDQATYKMWRRAEKQIVAGGNKGQDALQLLMLKRTYDGAVKSDSILRKAIGKQVYTGTELESFTPTTSEVKKAKGQFLFFFTANNSMEMTNETFLDEFRQYLAGEERKAEAADKAPRAYRSEVVKDNYYDLNDRYYGNNDVMASTPYHGTHVAGIIAAARNNGKGVDGIADNVKIMAIRAVPDGDEHDKDIALAIRYAVDNGAKIINMSFGKGFSPEKKWVDNAVKYAESKGVLLVHAAGNDASDVDSVENFPSPVFVEDKKRATNWITVGASGDSKAGGLIASFSNYGRNEVDVFAPGVKIYSTVPGGNQYGYAQGTSMASPVVAGIAALVLSYFPDLTPQQLKYVIETSAVKLTGKLNEFSNFSRTGGIVNASEALKLASTISNNKTAQPIQNKTQQKEKKPVKTF